MRGGKEGEDFFWTSETRNILILPVTRTVNLLLTSPSIRSLTSPSLTKR